MQAVLAIGPSSAHDLSTATVHIFNIYTPVITIIAEFFLEGLNAFVTLKNV